jgi:uncharacterized membrane protein (DUF2068 family)
MSKAVKAVAAFEAFKGAVVLLASVAALSLVHKDLHAVVLSLVEHLHLNPAAKYPEIFLLAANNLQNLHLVALALGAAAYSGLRFVEAFGLYRQRAWAEVLAASSGAVYVPFELLESLKQPTLLHVSLLVANVAVVAIMVYSLHQRRSRFTQNAA